MFSCSNSESNLNLVLLQLLRLNNNIKGSELQRPMSEVRGWRNEDRVVSECVGGRRSSVSTMSDAMEGEDVASALMLHPRCSDRLSLDFWGWNE